MTIERAITIEEIKLKDIPSMDKVIERLRLEKQEANQEWKETGFSHGIEDAQELSYSDFQALKKEGILEDTRDWVLDKNFDDDNAPDSDEIEIYLEGWVEGALHFWNEIKDRL